MTKERQTQTYRQTEKRREEKRREEKRKKRRRREEKRENNFKFKHRAADRETGVLFFT